MRAEMEQCARQTAVFIVGRCLWLIQGDVPLILDETETLNLYNILAARFEKETPTNE